MVLLTEKAKELNKHPDTLRRWNRLGLHRNGKLVKLTVHRVGGQTYIRPVDWDRFVELCAI